MSFQQLGPNDIICGRGKLPWNHEGNKRFRKLINANVERYMMTSSIRQKGTIIDAIVDRLHRVGSRFIKLTNNNNKTQQQQLMRVLDDRETHEKVGHALRDLVKVTKRKNSIQRNHWSIVVR